MIERRGDLWAENVDGWKPGDTAPWIVIPTNGERKSGGLAVMGAGVAKRAAELMPTLPAILGARLKDFGNHVAWLGFHALSERSPLSTATRAVVSFPTKHKWRDMSSAELIERSAKELVRLVDGHGEQISPSLVLLPRVGCGFGGLGWREVVRPILERHLKDDKYVVVNP